MNEEKPKKVLSLGDKPKLELKKPIKTDGAGAAGSVRQSFSHGRTNTVAVEVKRKRTVRPTEVEASSSKASGAAAPRTEDPGARQLTQGERDARMRALRGAVLENEQRKKDAPSQAADTPQETLASNEPAAPPMSERERLRLRELEELRSIQDQERTENERRRQEDEQRARNWSAQKRDGDKAGAKPAADKGAATPATKARDLAARHGFATSEEEDDSGARRGRSNRGGAAAPAPRKNSGGAGAGERRRTGKMTVTQALSDDEEGGGRHRSLASMRRRQERERRQAMQNQEQVKITRDVVIPEVITVQELANRMAERGADVIKSLMKMGVMATITQNIDADTAELIATEFGHRVKRVTEADVESVIATEDDTQESLKARPPVVTVMGHVDHGKTSLLDALREANVVAGEAGGITQHIGAYQVVLPEPAHGFDRITFIDTPGHAAFTEMRARGANITDIVVLVVAADDGIMPQTIEAIRHAQAAKAPMVVAINKCDLPTANPMRVRQELLQYDVQVEEMGGDVLSVEISAKKRIGLDKLKDTILLQAEIMDLKANPDRPAEGAVIEAKMERGRGSVATVLMRRGTLHVGDIFVAGSEWGRVRALIDDHGKNVVKAGPAMPVEVVGLNSTPVAGDELTAVPNEAKAREISEFRQRRRRMVQAAANKRGTLEQMLEDIKTGTVKELTLVIKGDVHGSVEALKTSLTKLTLDNVEVKVRILDAAVGPITESDVTLANASKALIVGFNVRANSQARDMAKRDGVEIRYYSIIYNVIDDVKAALTGMLSPDLREKFLGNAQIQQVFNITRVGKVAGCKVTEGIVKRGAKVRLLRDNVVIHEGTLKTLKRLKDEVKEVREGFECGMAFENYDDIKEGDVIECFEMEEIARQL